MSSLGMKIRIQITVLSWPLVSQFYAASSFEHRHSFCLENTLGHLSLLLFLFLVILLLYFFPCRIQECWNYLDFGSDLGYLTHILRTGLIPTCDMLYTFRTRPNGSQARTEAMRAQPYSMLETLPW